MYETSISMIRSSLSHLDDIIIKHSIVSKHPPSKINTSLPLYHQDMSNKPLSSTSSSPPVLPPISTLIPTSSSSSSLLTTATTNNNNNSNNKPALPPKPKILPIPSMMKPLPNPIPKPSLSTSSVNSINKKNRGRGNSVSFAIDIIESDHSHPVENVDRINNHTNNNMDHSNTVDDDCVDEYEDDDDDDEIVDFDQDNVYNTLPMRRNQSHPDILRPHTISDPQPSYVEKEDFQRKSLDIYHHATYEFNDINTKDVLTDFLIDPSILVPAQTNPGDSLAPPSLNSNTISEYLPLIPMPPLLSTHRLLQNQLVDLEASLNECKAKKRAMALLSESKNNNLSSTRSSSQLEKDMDEKILQRNASVAETRETLNKVRTLYMNAATVPSVMQFSPCLIAYQLTLIESSIFRNIPPEALLSHSARTPHAKIVASTDFFNYITRAIEHSILLPQEASRRAEIINRWIKIATKCLALNNYQTLKAIVSALGTPPVQRLRRTWDCIPKKRMARLDLLNLLMSESDNYEKYREQIGLIDNSKNNNNDLNHISNHNNDNDKKDWSKPIIPFLGVFIHDITYLLAATTKSKCPQEDARIQDVLLTLTRFQLTPPYPSYPPTSFIKSSLPKKHSFRPSTSLITNALSRTTASVKQRSNYIFGSSNTTNNNMSSNMINNNNPLMDDDSQNHLIELDQQLITQYLLMRPWVNERTVDELSILREPPKPRFGNSSSSTTTTTIGSSSIRSQNSSSIHSNNGGNTSSTYSSFSNTSSLGRFYSTNSSVTSWDDINDGMDDGLDDDDIYEENNEEGDDHHDYGKSHSHQHELYDNQHQHKDDYEKMGIHKNYNSSTSSFMKYLSHKRSHPTMIMSPVATTTPTSITSPPISNYRSLRTVQSFTNKPSYSSSSTTTTTANAATATTITTTTNHPSKVNENNAFSLVGHLRSLSLPTSDHPVTFRKRT
ncbi:unnamed protein product [Cunninghamella blakesleeana]